MALIIELDSFSAGDENRASANDKVGQDAISCTDPGTGTLRSAPLSKGAAGVIASELAKEGAIESVDASAVANSLSSTSHVIDMAIRSEVRKLTVKQQAAIIYKALCMSHWEWVEEHGLLFPEEPDVFADMFFPIELAGMSHFEELLVAMHPRLSMVGLDKGASGTTFYHSVRLMLKRSRRRYFADYEISSKEDLAEHILELCSQGTLPTKVEEQLQSYPQALAAAEVSGLFAEDAVVSESKRSGSGAPSSLEYRMGPDRFKLFEDREIRTNAMFARSSVDVAVKSFQNALRDCPEISLSEFPVEFWMKLGSEDHYIPSEVCYAIDCLPTDRLADILLGMLKDVQDAWVSDHAADFYGRYINWEFYYLPFGWQGVDLVERNYRAAVQPFFDDCLIRGDSDVLEKAIEEYKLLQGDLVERYSVESVNDLIDAVPKIALDYEQLDPAIAALMQKRELAFDIARQIVYHSPYLLSGRG